MVETISEANYKPIETGEGAKFTLASLLDKPAKRVDSSTSFGDSAKPNSFRCPEAADMMSCFTVVDAKKVVADRADDSSYVRASRNNRPQLPPASKVFSK